MPSKLWSVTMFKKALLILTSFLLLSTGFAEDVWTITDIQPWRNTFILTMDNGTVWKFQEDPGKTKYHTIYQPDGRGGYWPNNVPYHVPGRSSNNINYFQKGDPISPCFFEGTILVLKDMQGENPIGCALEEYLPNTLSSIYEIDSKGYSVIMSDGHEWTFSWWQAWASYYWETGDTLVQMKLSRSKEVVNLDRLLRKQAYFFAEPY